MERRSFLQALAALVVLRRWTRDGALVEYRPPPTFLAGPVDFDGVDDVMYSELPADIRELNDKLGGKLIGVWDVPRGVRWNVALDAATRAHRPTIA